MDEVFSKVECNGIPTRYSYKKLKLPHRKTNQGLRALSYVGPSLWNNLDKSLKTSASLNTFKHDIKGNNKHDATNLNSKYFSFIYFCFYIFKTFDAILKFFLF